MSCFVSGDGSVGTPFKTIAEAITQAGNGDTVAMATYAESLTVTEALSFVGTGGVTIAPGSAVAAAVTISGTVGAVSFEGITIDGDGLGKIGIRTASGADIASLSLTDVTVREIVDYGILVNVEHVGRHHHRRRHLHRQRHGSVNGASHIHLWGFAGDATLTDVTVTGAATGSPTSATNPEYGIQFTGRASTTASPAARPRRSAR